MPKKEAKITKTTMVRTPNALTIKTIKDAHNGKSIGKPIENVRSFINSLKP